jgi:hypothetical protein
MVTFGLKKSLSWRLNSNKKTVEREDDGDDKTLFVALVSEERNNFIVRITISPLILQMKKFE